MTLSVAGTAALAGSLERAGDQLTDLGTAHNRAADLIAAAANPPKRSGRLAASVRPGTGGVGALVVAGGPNVPYAGVIEYGSAKRNITARHYLRNAVTQTQSAWVKVYETAVADICADVRGA